ncbi:hypothetical protein [Aeromicrobium sp.]|uniref:DUF7507 domain-containing protein n=1 Tax=Aeromicrobium sp. TaxID=1871063 RepID=UPI0028A9A409|nr:hypothetical protein [Aeromicrobium sp.]
MTYSLPRRIFSYFFSALLIAGLLAVLPAVTKTAPVQAAEGDYQCADALYGTNGTGLYKLVPGATSVTETKVGDFPASVNSVAVVPRGSELYAMSAQSGGTATLYRFGQTAAYRTITGLSTSEFVVGGAINPETGDYWFSTTRTDNTTMRFFRIPLGTSGGSLAATPVMTTQTPGFNGVSTDFAFDSRGNAYVEFSSTDSGYTNRLMRFTAAQLTTGGAQTGTQITTLGANGTAYPGIAFGSDGYIYVQGGSNLYRLRPTNGTSQATLATSRAYNDLGSCATPGVMDNVVKDVVARKKATDQFTVSLAGDNLTTLTGTTAGTDTGLQLNPSEIAGPSLVLPGATYTFRETAGNANTSLGDYQSTYECINVDTRAVITSGTGTSGTLTVPKADAQGVNANVVCTFTNTPNDPRIDLTKTASGTPQKAGDTITYSFGVTNTGNVPLSNIVVTDPLLAGKTITCAATTLAAGASTTCSVSSAYAATQADVDSGSIGSTATVTGTPSTGAAVTDTASTTTTVNRTARLKLVKSASGSPTKAGDRITYSFTVENTGNTTVTGVNVIDGLVTGETCSPSTLAPGATANCTADDYVVTQGDVNAGTVNNTADLVGTPPSGVSLSRDGDSSRSTVTPLTRLSELTLVKSASGTPTKVGDQVTYSFKVTNTGNTTVTGVAVTDPLVGAVSCPTGSLAPAASVTCTAAAYTVTQADVDAGTVVNTATATGTGPGGTPVPASTSSTGKTATPIAADAGITVALAHSTNLISTVGQTITYTHTVTNNGDVTLSGVSLTDTLGTSITCPETGPLAPGASRVCTSQYTVTQADFEVGAVVNTTTGRATTPQAVEVSGDSLRMEKALFVARRLSATLAASGSPTKAGDEIVYTLTVTNTGNVAVKQLTASDDLPVAYQCEVTSLAPGESTTCTTKYAVRQGDVDAGQVTNVASASALTLKDGPVASLRSNTVVTPIVAPAELTTTVVASGTPAKAGDTITYTTTVTNTGPVTVTQVKVTDDLGNTYVCNVATLAPGAKATCTTTHTVTQAQVDAGKVANTATGTATDPSQKPVEDDSALVEKAIAANGAVTITLGQSAGTITQAGQGVLYTYSVQNTGNVTLTDLRVTDTQGREFECGTSLQVGWTAICSRTHTVTQAEVDAGRVANTASVTALTPTQVEVEDDSDQVAKTIVGAAELTTTVVASGTPTKKGEKITYTATVENTGAVTVDTLKVTDELGNTYECDAVTLAPGAKTECTTTYAVTQADVDAGEVDNTATGGGLTPSDEGVSDGSDEVTTSIAKNAELTTTLLDSGTPKNAGDTITYTMTVANVGNVTVDDLTVVDDLGTAYTCDVTELAPGARATCEAVHTVTQTEVDAGTVVNSGKAAGADPAGDGVEDASNDVDTPIAAEAELSTTLVPSGSPTKKGDEITWTATVKNTGNVTVDTVEVTDELGNAYTCDVTGLAPGASATCVANDTVTQAEVNAGTVANTATGAGTGPKDAAVTDDSAEATVTIAPGAALTVVLTQSANTVTKNGQEIAYGYTVENTGNVTVDELVVTDALGNTLACDVTELAPGEKATCTATHQVTQADVDGAEVQNQAKATGSTPADAKVDGASNTVRKPILAAPALTTTVEADGSPKAEGDEITYTVTIENTGNVTVDHVEATDELGNTYVCDVTTLVPGEKATCVATHPVTQADVDAGQVDNTITAGGQDPSGDPVDDESDPVTTTIPASPELTTTVVPTGSPEQAGDEVTYTVTIENTGNVTVDHVEASDELGNTYVCDVTTLAPGEKATCVATYPVTQPDIDAGEVDNTSTAVGQDPSGDPVEDESAETVVDLEAAPALTITDAAAGVLADADHDGRDSAGDTVAYTYEVRNTGNVTLRDAVVTDTLGTVIACVPGTLAPGDTATCVSVPVPVTQAQVDAGHVTTRGTATAQPPAGATVASPASDELVTPLESTDELAIVTRISSREDVNGDGRMNAGDLVFYAFDVTNAGNVTLDGVTVRDARLAGQGIAVECPTPLGRLGIAASASGPGGPSLAPQQATTCVGAKGYTVTAGDVQDRVIENSATVDATVRRTGDAVTAKSDVVTAAPVASPKLTLTTEVEVKDTNRNRHTDTGDEITYTYTVTNTGDITLQNVAISDDRLAEQGITITCRPTTLAPGGTATCTMSDPYVVTDEDVENGSVLDTATAHGEDPVGGTTTSVLSEEVESVVETQAEVDEVETPREPREREPRERELADAGGPAVAVGALGVVAVGLGLGLVGAARRRRHDEAA